MKKIVTYLCCFAMLLGCFGSFAACKTVDDQDTIYVGIQGVPVDIKEFILEGAVLSDFQRGARNNNTDLYLGIADSFFKEINTGANNPQAIVPHNPLHPCTAIAPTGSSTSKTDIS